MPRASFSPAARRRQSWEDSRLVAPPESQILQLTLPSQALQSPVGKDLHGPSILATEPWDCRLLSGKEIFAFYFEYSIFGLGRFWVGSVF